MNKNSNGQIRLVRKLEAFEVLYFLQETVLSYLLKHPNAIYDKKFYELLVGWILAQFLGETQRQSMFIGFPARKGWEANRPSVLLTLPWLLNNYEDIIDDSDVDICIGNKDLCVRFQITRFVHLMGKRPHRRLADLILKKCQKYREHSNLNLVVSIENKPNISKQEIAGFYTKVQVPFESIILIGKASNERGHFSLSQLYPKAVVGKTIKLPLRV